MNHFYNVYYFIDKFDSDEILNLDKKINIIYRNYHSKINDDEIKKIKKICLLGKRKFFISNNLKVVLKHNLDGLYIPSFNKNLNFKNINTKNKFNIIGSAHNLREIKIKEKQGCSLIFLSPIFKNSKKKTYLEIIKFNLLSIASSVGTIALGGINNSNIRRLYCSKVKGYAGISGIKKTGL